MGIYMFKTCQITYFKFAQFIACQLHLHYSIKVSIEINFVVKSECTCKELIYIFLKNYFTVIITCPWYYSFQLPPGSSAGIESTCNAGDPGSISGSGRSTREEIGYLLQYSWASLGAQLVNNPPAVWETWVRSLGWEDLWKREWLPTPAFWPGEFHGLYSQGDHKESDTTDQLLLWFHFHFI